MLSRASGTKSHPKEHSVCGVSYLPHSQICLPIRTSLPPNMYQFPVVFVTNYHQHKITASVLSQSWGPEIYGYCHWDEMKVSAGPPSLWKDHTSHECVYVCVYIYMCMCIMCACMCTRASLPLPHFSKNTCDCI